MEIKVDSDQDNLRLDRFIRKLLPELSLSEIYQMIKSGDILVNGKPRSQDWKLRKDDKIFLPFIPEQAKLPEIPEREKKKINFLYEDENLLIIEKPWGIPVHSGSHWEYGVINIVAEIKRIAIYPVHRIDKETSGLLILAKNRQTAIKLSRLISSHQIQREYIALVRGKIEKSGTIRSKTSKNSREKSPRGKIKLSITHYTTEKIFRDTTLLRIKLETGRTHQIRIQFANTGHPVAGDWKYGQKKFNVEMKKIGLNRLFLHSHHLIFEHPVTGKKIDLTSPLPEELDSLLKKLSS